MFEKEAEEYTMKKICKNCTYRCYTENILKSNKLDCFSYARGYKIFKDGAEFGYKRGLEAGRLKWHDLRKNPEDLPPRKGLETYSERLITDKGYSVYNFRKCRWYVDEPDCDCMVHRDVIAWCEIPKFEEK